MNLIKACFKSLYLLVDLLSGCGFLMKISLALVWEFKCSNSKRFGKITHLLPVIFLVLFLFLQVAKNIINYLKKKFYNLDNKGVAVCLIPTSSEIEIVECIVVLFVLCAMSVMTGILARLDPILNLNNQFLTATSTFELSKNSSELQSTVNVGEHYVNRMLD